MTPRLFIVDDEIPARQRLKTLLADIAADFPHVLAGEAAQARQALDGIAACMPYIVLLDVQMPEMNGIEMAERVRQTLSAAPAVIFVTAFDDYALKAFDVQASDYLLKPVRAERLLRALQRAAASIEADRAKQPARRQHLPVQDRGRLLLVPVGDVLYLKAELKYVTLRTLRGDFLIEESLSAIEDEFPDRFVRVHRNALVAREAIIGVERGPGGDPEQGEAERTSEAWHVLLRGLAERVPISRRQWPVIKALVK